MNADICSMRLLLIAATPFEIASATRFLAGQPPALQGHEVQQLITGIGSTATAFALGKELQTNNYQLVIQAGVAGSFIAAQEKELRVVTRDRLGDLGVWETTGFHDIFSMGLAGADTAPYENGWLVNHHTALLQWTGLPAASAITVNQISTSAQQISMYRQQWQPELESMEGAALHLACASLGIPYLQLRAVSNQVGIRDKSRWQMKEAIEQLNQKLIELFHQLNNLPL